MLLFGNISNKDLIAYFEEFMRNIEQTFSDGSNYVQFSRDGIVAD